MSATKLASGSSLHCQSSRTLAVRTGVRAICCGLPYSSNWLVACVFWKNSAVPTPQTLLAGMREVLGFEIQVGEHDVKTGGKHPPRHAIMLAQEAATDRTVRRHIRGTLFTFQGQNIVNNIRPLLGNRLAKRARSSAISTSDLDKVGAIYSSVGSTCGGGSACLQTRDAQPLWAGPASGDTLAATCIPRQQATAPFLAKELGNWRPSTHCGNHQIDRGTPPTTGIYICVAFVPAPYSRCSPRCTC